MTFSPLSISLYIHTRPISFFRYLEGEKCGQTAPIDMTRTRITPARPATPRSRMHAFRRQIWRYKVLWETTFGISVLEPWERLVFCTYVHARPCVSLTEHAVIVMLLVVSLFAMGCVRYLPYVPLQLARLQHRLAYYLWGNDEVSTLRRAAADASAMREL